jgi:hypothetical protein
MIVKEFYEKNRKQSIQVQCANVNSYINILRTNDLENEIAKTGLRIVKECARQIYQMGMIKDNKRVETEDENEINVITAVTEITNYIGITNRFEVQ